MAWAEHELSADSVKEALDFFLEVAAHGGGNVVAVDRAKAEGVGGSGGGGAQAAGAGVKGT